MEKASKPTPRGNNDAPSISKHGSPVRPDAQMVALRAHCVRTALKAPPEGRYTAATIAHTARGHFSAHAGTMSHQLAVSHRGHDASKCRSRKIQNSVPDAHMGIFRRGNRCHITDQWLRHSTPEPYNSQQCCTEDVFSTTGLRVLCGVNKYSDPLHSRRRIPQATRQRVMQEWQ